MGSKPDKDSNQANKPEKGFMNKFFQINALTVGIIKKGAIAKILAKPLPKKFWFNKSANAIPNSTETTSTEKTKTKVFHNASKKAKSVKKYS